MVVFNYIVVAINLQMLLTKKKFTYFYSSVKFMTVTAEIYLFIYLFIYWLTKYKW